MRYSVLGANGFVGAALVEHLRGAGQEVREVTRSELHDLSGDLGHVIYCIGLTADFRKRPFDAVDAHVVVLSDVLRRCCCRSFLYLSSTRIYAQSANATESGLLSADPANPDHLYNLSKLMGESLVLSCPHAAWRVARLSNVVGLSDRSENFLTSVVNEAVSAGRVTFRTSAATTRDFIDIHDVCCLLAVIAASGRHRIYNVASGENTSNKTIANLLERSGVPISFEDGARDVAYPRIDIGCVRDEFGYQPTPFETSFERLVSGRIAVQRTI